MSMYGTPPPPPDERQELSQTESLVQSKKKSKAAPILISGVVGIAIGVAGTLGGVALMDDFSNDEAVAESPEVPSSTAGPEADNASDPTNEPSSAPTPADPFEPTVDDFDVETSVKEQTCFDSHGCNTTLRTEPVYIGEGVPIGNWEVTYEITGIEDGPMIRSFDVTGEEVSFDDEAYVYMPGRDAEVEIEITDVREGFSRY